MLYSKYTKDDNNTHKTITTMHTTTNNKAHKTT